MRILCVHPGASVSTHDVWVGLVAGLKAQGHEVYDYALDGRIEMSGRWLHYVWKRNKKATPKPNSADIQYHAGEHLIGRALRVQPDVVLVVSAMYLHPDLFVLMKRAGLTVALLLTESPYLDMRQARLLPHVDLAWTNEATSARALGIGYLPHAYHPDIHTAATPLDPDVPSHDVVFVGTGFEERIETLAAVDWSGIDLALYGTWDLLGSRHPLRRFIKGGYRDNAVTAQLYRKAKIGLNLYRTSMGFGKNAPKVVQPESLNPRAYELAAVGCFTISDWRPEVATTFGERVPTFKTSQELRPLVDRWLADDPGRAAMAAALPACVVGETWHARAQTITRDLDALVGRSRPAAPLPASRGLSLAQAAGG